MGDEEVLLGADGPNKEAKGDCYKHGLERNIRNTEISNYKISFFGLLRYLHLLYELQSAPEEVWKKYSISLEEEKKARKRI